MKYGLLVLFTIGLLCSPSYANGRRNVVRIKEVQRVEVEKVRVKEVQRVEKVVQRVEVRKEVIAPVLAVNTGYGYASVVQPSRAFLRVQDYSYGSVLGVGGSCYSSSGQSQLRSEVEALRNEVQRLRQQPVMPPAR